MSEELSTYCTVSGGQWQYRTGARDGVQANFPFEEFEFHSGFTLFKG
jgi:hypothetical protein